MQRNYKKIRFVSFFIFFFMLVVSCCSLPNVAANEMSVTSSGIKSKMIDDKYGARGNQKKGSVPTLSLPIMIADAPDGTACFAIYMTDPDSTPEWTHWLAVNIEAAELPENASISLADAMIQGKNSFGTSGYGGPTPPDRPHNYVITVYALDSKVNLKHNFTLSQFKSAIKGHVIAEAKMTGRYNN